MPPPRSTWRSSPAPTTTALRGLARPSARAPRAGRSSGCGPLVLPDDPHHDPLHEDVALVHAQRGHRGVRGLEPDPAARLAIEFLHGGVLAVHQCDDRLPVVGGVALVHDDEVAVLDVLVDHGGASDLEHVAPAAPRDQLVGDRAGAVARARREGCAGRHEPEQGQLRRAGLSLRRHDLDGPALVVGAPDVALALEVGEMFVDRGERLEPELAGDLLEARGVALGLDVRDRKSTRLNSSHLVNSYAVFCLKKKKKQYTIPNQIAPGKTSNYDAS